MLTRRIFACVAVLIPAAVLSGLSLTAQDKQPDQPAQPTRVGQAYVLPPSRTTTFGFEPGYQELATVPQWMEQPESEVGTALKQFRAAETDDAKQDAKSELRDALAAEYEDKMNQYDAHIEALEKELESMRERLTRRRKAKDDMVSLKLKEMMANADGLGWPSGPSRTPSPRQTFFPGQNTSPFAAPSPRPSILTVPRRTVKGVFEQIN